MKEVKELLNTFKQTKQEEADLEQFSKAIVDLVRKNTVGFEKVAKKQDKKEYKPNPEMPEGFLNYVKSKELELTIHSKIEPSKTWKGKLVGFDNYTLVLSIEMFDAKAGKQVDNQLYWIPKHSVDFMTYEKE